MLLIIHPVIYKHNTLFILNVKRYLADVSVNIYYKKNGKIIKLYKYKII